MVQLEQKAGRKVPLLVCDSCGKRIADGRDASVLYQTSPASDIDAHVLFSHNGRCANELQESLGDRYAGSDGLSRYLAELADAVRLPVDDLARPGTA